MTTTATEAPTTATEAPTTATEAPTTTPAVGDHGKSACRTIEIRPGTLVQAQVPGDRYEYATVVSVHDTGCFVRGKVGREEITWGVTWEDVTVDGDANKPDGDDEEAAAPEGADERRRNDRGVMVSIGPETAVKGNDAERFAKFREAIDIVPWLLAEDMGPFGGPDGAFDEALTDAIAEALAEWVNGDGYDLVAHARMLAMVRPNGKAATEAA